jgi:hypothetical protein
LFADKTRRKIMTRVNTASKEKARRAGAIAIGFDQDTEQRTFRIRKAMLLAAIVMLGTAMASHAFAAGHMGGGIGGGFGGGHMSHGFTPPIVESPTMPAPTFNPSDSYTLPQSPEAPVSPASPGSIFGNG